MRIITRFLRARHAGKRDPGLSLSWRSSRFPQIPHWRYKRVVVLGPGSSLNKQRHYDAGNHARRSLQRESWKSAFSCSGRIAVILPLKAGRFPRTILQADAMKEVALFVDHVLEFM